MVSHSPPHYSNFLASERTGPADNDVADQEAFWENKIDSAYRPGYGTVLFFEDDAVVKGWQENMPPLASVGTALHIKWTVLIVWIGVHRVVG